LAKIEILLQTWGFNFEGVASTVTIDWDLAIKKGG
jgi:hypothetical protein